MDWFLWRPGGRLQVEDGVCGLAICILGACIVIIQLLEHLFLIHCNSHPLCFHIYTITPISPSYSASWRTFLPYCLVRLTIATRSVVYIPHFHCLGDGVHRPPRCHSFRWLILLPIEHLSNFLA
ncbi:hypothetical protein BDD12DRAFT_296695 [Trichophaea hybrida]|nr:hypothetical protein BDD12DRAFT_296695 [Trichophaea hybrida]